MYVNSNNFFREMVIAIQHCEIFPPFGSGEEKALRLK